jgi:glycine dehydrogenase
MVEPTESEPLVEHDRFCNAMIAIRDEIRHVEAGVWPQDDNPLKNAPHTAAALLSSEWTHPYPRKLAAYPVAGLKQSKYWSPVARVDNVHGDRNLFCSCIPLSELAAAD